MTLLTESKSTIFFNPKFGDTLDVSAKNFVIRDAEKKVRKKIPAISARDILVFGDTNFSAKVFALAAKNLISIHFLSGNGKFYATTKFNFPKNVFLRHAQIRAHDDENLRLEIAKKFVRAKIQNQKTFLQKMRMSGANFGDAEQISSAENLEKLRGLEGAVAKNYFEFLRSKNVIKNPDFKFTGRWKRPPRDEINAILSFCYSMIHAEILSQISIVGLDPYFGFLHDQKYGHAALASDFVEIFRGIVDHFVVKKINLGEFKIDDFEKETGDIFKLSRDGFAKFFPKWAQFLRFEKFENDRTLTAVIERDLRKFVHFLNGDEPDFEPFVWKK